jgi:Tat protein secretion system quality control protein TatD with DNase activity
MDRYKSVEVNVKMSITMHCYTGEVQNTKHAVPQGSIQAFLYFFIYISDCSKTIRGKYKQLLLANDTD